LIKSGIARLVHEFGVASLTFYQENDIKIFKDVNYDYPFFKVFKFDAFLYFTLSHDHLIIL
jgi:hypothetical protein